jgi:hypothetical protein
MQGAAQSRTAARRGTHSAQGDSRGRLGRSPRRRPQGLSLTAAGDFPPKQKMPSAPQASIQGRQADAPAGGKGAVARSRQQPQRSGAWEHAIAEGEAPGSMNGLFSRDSFANRCKRQPGFIQLLAIRYGHYVGFFVLGLFSAGWRVFAVNGNFATACRKISKPVLPTVFAFLFGFGRICHCDGFSAAIRRRVTICKINGL